MFTHVRDCIIIDYFESTFINVNAPAVLRDRVRRACDDRGRVDAKYLALDAKRGELSDIQMFYNTLLPWGRLCWVFFRAHLFDPDDVYLMACDETVVLKSGDETHGLSRFFFSTIGQTIPGLAFFAVSIISVKQRCSYPMLMKQVVRDETSTPAKKATETSTPSETKGRPGCQKGSKNRNKSEVVLTDTLKHLQSMLKKILTTIAGHIEIRYFLLDGYFGNNNTLQNSGGVSCEYPSKSIRDR